MRPLVGACDPSLSPLFNRSPFAARGSANELRVYAVSAFCPKNPSSPHKLISLCKLKSSVNRGRFSSSSKYRKNSSGFSNKCPFSI